MKKGGQRISTCSKRTRTQKQKSALWKKYKSSGKLPALAQSKGSSVKRTTTKRYSIKRVLDYVYVYVYENYASSRTANHRWFLNVVFKGCF